LGRKTKIRGQAIARKEEEETSYRTLDCTIHAKEQKLFGKSNIDR